MPLLELPCCQAGCVLSQATQLEMFCGVFMSVTYNCALQLCIAGPLNRKLPHDLSVQICLYISYRDQCRSLQRIHKKSNEIFGTVNNETTWKTSQTNDALESLLRKNVSDALKMAIFGLHRSLMLNEQHSLRWPTILQTMGFDVERPGSLSICSFNRTAFKKLSRHERLLIWCSRAGRSRWQMWDFYYLYFWEYLHSLSVLPHPEHVFDNEAVHCDSAAMNHLRYLIAECGLLVVQPKHITSVVRGITEFWWAILDCFTPRNVGNWM